MIWYIYFLNVAEMWRDKKKDESYRQRVNMRASGLYQSDVQWLLAGLSSPCCQCQAVSGHVRPQSKLCKSGGWRTLLRLQARLVLGLKTHTTTSTTTSNTSEHYILETFLNLLTNTILIFLSTIPVVSTVNMMPWGEDIWCFNRSRNQLHQSFVLLTTRETFYWHLCQKIIFFILFKSGNEDILLEFGCAWLRWWPLR